MTSVRGFIQLLGSKKEYQNDRSYFDLIIEELDRANSIITEYLSMAKNKRVDLQLKSLDYLVTTIYPIIMSDANLREINIHLDLNNPPKPLIDVISIKNAVYPHMFPQYLTCSQLDFYWINQRTQSITQLDQVGLMCFACS